MLFTSTQIGGLELKNRLVRSATYDGGADRNGHVTEWQRDLYAALARGGAGLVVTGLFSVHPSGRLAGRQNIISDDAAVDGLRALAATVHCHGGKIAVQIAHGGRECHAYQAYRGRTAVAPSLLEGDGYPHPHRALTEEEIEAIVESFGAAAGRVREAGCDAVQLHGAHAYLVSQFLSPAANRRNDRWGGSLAARGHFLGAVYRAMRRRVGDDFPVMIKLGVADGIAGGLTFEEGRVLAEICMTLGFDAVEVSQGLRGRSYEETEFRTGIKAPEEEAYFRSWAAEIRKRATVPVIMVGGLRRMAVIREALEAGDADLAALSRPLICEPDLIERWRRGDQAPSRCISCNHCFEALLEGRRLGCVVSGAGDPQHGGAADRHRAG
jgi:2,4-dienoyl-CoA reductase-like NADH-dependent reductase (Old Yellow Enzyme family)